MRDALVAALEVGQTLGDCLQAGKVVRSQHLAVHDREVDFDLFEPARADGSMNWHQSRVRLCQSLH